MLAFALLDDDNSQPLSALANVEQIAVILGVVS
jgi:hypothetical protein